MNVAREFLETSTIHGLNYISSSKTVAAKAIWVIIVSISFGVAGFMINNAYLEWQESPIATSIKTYPISKLDFPSVTVCPPRGSNTALNHVLERVNNRNFTEEKRQKLLRISDKTFLVDPNKKYVKDIINLVNVNNIMHLYEGHISMPEVDLSNYTFSIK